jgi:hypothetical protein
VYYWKKKIDIELEHCLAADFEKVTWKMLKYHFTDNYILSIPQKNYNSISEYK